MPKIVAKRTKLAPSSNRVTSRLRLEDAFDQFYRAKRIEQLKPRTLQDHVTHFRYFREWGKNAHPSMQFVDEITPGIVREYIDSMLQQGVWETHATIHSTRVGLSPVTVNIRLRSLKCFFRWLHQEGILEANPVENIKLLKTEEDTIVGFTPEEVSLLLSQPAVTRYTGFRDFVLLCFLLDSGARISETLSLTVHEVDWVNHLVYFPSRLTKNRKPRSVPLSQKVIHLLKELQEENEANFGKQEFLFLSSIGTKLQADVVRERISAYGKQAGITRVRVSAHTFRHTMAHSWVKSGGDIFALQKILGHSSMEMVRRYVQMQNSDLQEAHAKFSPLHHLQFQN